MGKREAGTSKENKFLTNIQRDTLLIIRKCKWKHNGTPLNAHKMNKLWQIEISNTDENVECKISHLTGVWIDKTILENRHYLWKLDLCIRLQKCVHNTHLQRSNVLFRTSLVAQTVKHLSTMRETRVQSLGWEDPLEKEMAIHSITIAWKIHNSIKLEII